MPDDDIPPTETPAAARQLRAIAEGMVETLLALTDREIRDEDRAELREFAFRMRQAIAAAGVEVE